MDLNSKPIEKDEVGEISEADIKLEYPDNNREDLIPEKDHAAEYQQFVEDTNPDTSSEKLDELLAIENETQENFKVESFEDNIIEKLDAQIEEIIDESVTEKSMLKLK